jgi:hypothetical protein
MNLLPPDAAGADSVGNHGDTAVPAARLIETRPCEFDELNPGAMDLINHRDRQHPETWHFSAAEWAEFTAAVKAGRYDTAGG